MNDNKDKKIFGLSRNVVFLGIVSFWNDLSSEMIFPFLPIFLKNYLGASSLFIGLIEGVADSTASILKIFSGRWSDLADRRKPFVVFGYSLSAVIKPLLSIAAAPWHALVLRFFDRTGKGFRDAPRDALISFSTAKETLGRAFGFHRAMDTAGGALGPLRQKLELVRRAVVHDGKHPLNLLEREVRVEYVAHRVHKDPPRLLPLAWELQAVLPEARREGILSVRRRVLHRQLAQVDLTRAPVGHRMGVAVVTPSRNLGAPRHGVPDFVSPLDLGRHASLPGVRVKVREH